MNPDEIAEKILEGISKQKFYDWYNEGNFSEYIDPPEKRVITKEKILKDIKKLFSL
jgi:hypothetical protein